MNQQPSDSQPTETSGAVPASSHGENPTTPLPRIERCEFEQLLQRAMEILNARDLKTEVESKNA